LRKSTRASATEVREEVSAATVRTSSSGTLLTSKIDRTDPLAAMATLGMMRKSGMYV
jgi:hypothetical protein